MAPLRELMQGTILGPYRITGELGRGASAIVYRALPTGDGGASTKANHPVALKVREKGEDDLDRRFLREFETLRGLRIPGVARTFEAGETQQLLWFSMELVTGVSIRRWIRAGRDTQERCMRAVQVGQRLFQTLAGIHRHGFIHRDLKPSNVLVDGEGQVTILDFGAVRWWYRGTTLTDKAGLIGTLPFMAPEHLAGLPITPRADVFSAGLMLYEGIVGQRTPPSHAHEWLRIQCLERFPSPSVVDPHVPRALSTVVDHCMRFDPMNRPDARVAALALAASTRPGAPAEWPEPHSFTGRANLMRQMTEAITQRSPSVIVVRGPTGCGRRRLTEELRRHCLLRAIQSFAMVCDESNPGTALGNTLQQLLNAPPDRAWRSKVAGADTELLLEMWPHLPLTHKSKTNQMHPDLSQIAEATLNAFRRAAEVHRLILVLENFDQTDALTSRFVRLVGAGEGLDLTVVCVVDDRWLNRHANRCLTRLERLNRALVIRPGDLDAQSATSLACQLAPIKNETALGACSPQRAVEAGLNALAHLRNELLNLPPMELLPLALARGPLPARVLENLSHPPDQNTVPTRPSDGSSEVAAQLRARDVLRESPPQQFELASTALKSWCLACMPDRKDAEDRLAEAISSEWSDAPAHAHVAHHRIHGSDPSLALVPSIRAALAAEQADDHSNALRWLLVVDGLPRKPDDTDYLSHRFDLAWCRARIALLTHRVRIRRDLYEQAQQRARTSEQHARVSLLEVELLAREGKVNVALAHCQQVVQATKDKLPQLAMEASLRAGQLQLQLGDLASAKRHVAIAARLRPGSTQDLPQVRLERLRADVEDAMGDASAAASRCRSTLGLALSLNARRETANLHLRLGSALIRLGDRVSAEESVWTARRMLRQLGLTAEEAEAALLLAELAHGRGDLAAAQLLLSEANNVLEHLHHTRLVAIGLAHSLEVATTRADGQGAADTISRYQSLNLSVSAWIPAMIRWLRNQDQLKEAVRFGKASLSSNLHNSPLIRAQIELARTLMDQGKDAEAFETTQVALRAAQDRQLGDLFMMARMVAGAAASHADTTWDYALEVALSNPWVSLSLVALEMDARRCHARGDLEAANRRLAALQSRSAELEFRPEQRTAKKMLKAIQFEVTATER